MLIGKVEHTSNRSKRALAILIGLLGLVVYGLCVQRVNLLTLRSSEQTKIVCPSEVPQVSCDAAVQCASVSPQPAHAFPRPGQARRSLTVLSCWEKLGSAVMTFGRIMRMAETFEFELLLPPVNRSEIGAKILPRFGVPLSKNTQFETYFDVPRLRQKYSHISEAGDYAAGIPTDYSTDHMLVIDFANDTCQQITPKLEQHRIETNQTYVIHCVPEPKTIQELEEFFDSICPDGARCNVAWYEWRKTAVPFLASSKHNHLLWASFHPSIREMARELTGEKGSTTPPNYIAAQFRSGFFFRHIPIQKRSPEYVVAAYATRARQMHECLSKLIGAALEAQKASGAAKIYIASDLYGTVPETYPNAAVRKVAWESFRDARNHIATFTSISTTPMLDGSNIPSDYDPHTISTIVDVQIALDSAQLVTVNNSGTYSTFNAETKQLAGGRVTLIECERSQV